MIRVENLIVEAVCFIPMKLDPDNMAKSIDTIKGNITMFMKNKGYFPMDEPMLFKSRFLSMTFLRELSERGTYLSERAKRGFGMMSESELIQKKFFNSLSNTRDELPFQVAFCLAMKNLEGTEGFVITIRSEPAVVFKMRQLKRRPNLDDFELSDIIESNKNFINNVMIGNLARILKKPHTLSEYVVTPTLEKLQKFGFNKVVELLKQGQTKIENGGTEDGLTDLREALVNFTGELLRKIENKSANKITRDLKTLQELGYIDQWMYDIIKKYLYDWLYSYLSAKPVHRREKISYDDAKFIYNIAEEIMGYLSEKVLLRR